MPLTPAGAHRDLGTRDMLPSARPAPRPPARRGRMRRPSTSPRLHYPDRLNCAGELLDRTAADSAPDRPAFRSGDRRCLDVRRAARPRRPDRARPDRRPRAWCRATASCSAVPPRPGSWRAGSRVLKAGGVAVTVLALQRQQELRAPVRDRAGEQALCDVRAWTSCVKAGVPGLRVTTYGGTGPEDLLSGSRRRPEPLRAGRTSQPTTSR